MYIDTHTHLCEDSLYKNLDELAKQFSRENLDYLINVSTNINDIERLIEIADKYNNIYISLGIHPHYADQQDIISVDTKLYNNPKVTAIGETGLDFYKNISSKDNQINLFKKHIDISRKYKLPLIIHQRNSIDEIKTILLDCNYDLQGIMHCFSGTKEDAEWFIEKGFYISFAGNLTYPKANALKTTAKSIPIDKILLETDSPWLAPQPVRGKTNTPLYIKHTYKELAQLRNISVQTLSKHIRRNFFNLFEKIDHD